MSKEGQRKIRKAQRKKTEEKRDKEISEEGQRLKRKAERRKTETRKREKR